MSDKNNNKKEIQIIIDRLEGLKKKSYGASELRNRNQMMSRLDRVQDKELVERISRKQKEIKEKVSLKDISYDLSKEDGDILDMFGIQKKKKVQKSRGGRWDW